MYGKKHWKWNCPKAFWKLTTKQGNMKKIALLGSTGSIGTQTLDVVRQHPTLFEAYILTANNNADLLIAQAREFCPDTVVITNEDKYAYVIQALSDLPIKVYTGEAALAQVVEMPSVDIVVAAMVGFAGLRPTIQALKAHKPLALANKETLVVAGELITRLAAENRCPILPVDSEHSAIFQSITGESNNPIEKILLTASGGPFRKMSEEELDKVTAQEALQHPNWKMGAKITIDSATMMNKGFEMIEAKWLFGVEPRNIDVVVHPESIIHSAVQFEDGCVKAQLAAPDMRLPIQYALTYPKRLPLDTERLDFFALSSLHFERPDMEKFPCLRLAYEAIDKGGNMPCILNAANEVANQAFRENKITFRRIAEIIEATMQQTGFSTTSALDNYFETDKEARKVASSLL